MKTTGCITVALITALITEPRSLFAQDPSPPPKKDWVAEMLTAFVVIGVGVAVAVMVRDIAKKALARSTPPPEPDEAGATNAPNHIMAGAIPSGIILLGPFETGCRVEDISAYSTTNSRLQDPQGRPYIYLLYTQIESGSDWHPECTVTCWINNYVVLAGTYTNGVLNQMKSFPITSTGVISVNAMPKKQDPNQLNRYRIGAPANG